MKDSLAQPTHAKQGCTCSGKICSKCNEWKCIEDFYRDKGCAGGRRPDCRRCRTKTDATRSLELRPYTVEVVTRTRYTFNEVYATSPAQAKLTISEGLNTDDFDGWDTRKETVITVEVR